MSERQDQSAPASGQQSIGHRGPSYQRSSYRGPDYDGRRFGPEGALPGTVRGQYHQQSELIWAEFGGGTIRTGRLVGVCDNEGVIDLAYCEITVDGEIVAGRCVSTPTVLPDGRIRLTEHWHRSDGSSGVSCIEELPMEGGAPSGSMSGNHDVTEG